ncbi:hypothetical protein Golob_027608 [Gossypium lobatum]|uniref:Uncharacterized protein n=1 Tax=Gossypium lobatum TaxID=34289 RepID=A0A7J8NIP5_9ROSI|nr:hypothetical protein [Gossypium lobatum]
MIGLIKGDIGSYQEVLLGTLTTMTPVIVG